MGVKVEVMVQVFFVFPLSCLRRRRRIRESANGKYMVFREITFLEVLIKFHRGASGNMISSGGFGGGVLFHGWIEGGGGSDCS